MHDDDGVDERRALQAKAYGRGGGLTDAEASRLRRLEAERAVAAAPPAAAPPVVASPASAPAAEETARESASVATLVGAESPSAEEPQDLDAEPPVDAAPRRSDSEPRALLRRYGLPTAIAVAVFVGIGILLGWLVFGRHDAAPEQLSAAQQQWQGELIASDFYDPGSIRAVRTERDVVIWYATRKDGELVCLVLGDGERSAPVCGSREQVLTGGLYSSLVTAVEGEELRYEIGAQLYLTRSGEPAVIAYSYIASGSSNAYDTPEEVAIAATLADSGFDSGSLTVAGYDGDVPLWIGTEKSTYRLCLIYDGSLPDPATACREELVDDPDTEPLVLERVDDAGERTRYEYTVGYTRQYLTITHGEDSGDASGG